MSRGHYVQRDDNFIGEEVWLRFTQQESGGEQSVYEEVVVGGVVADCRIYGIDTNEARERLAGYDVSPDMIPRR